MARSLSYSAGPASWARPGYGKYRKGRGGVVSIGSTKPGAFRPTFRTVSIALAFDPLATSMVPVRVVDAAKAA